MGLLQPDHLQHKTPLATPSSGDKAGDNNNNNRTRGLRTLDDRWDNNFPHMTPMPWIPVQQLRKPSPKQTKKNIGKKAAASNAINKAILRGTVLAKRLVLMQQKPQMLPKLPASFLKPLLKKQLPPASPLRSVN